ncbi:MAG: DUF4381 domain-containing protein [Gammaproteobacteria bacterium]|nr:DUF4381 domain-containing protein [Gammaproteobacteria bacterium]
MEAPNPLHQQLAALPPLAMPEPVSWWPPAVGWWLLAALLLLLLIVIWRKAQQYWQSRRLRQRLQAELADYYRAWQNDADSARYLHRSNALLRRCVQHYFAGRMAVALRGEDWLAALDQLVATPCLQSDSGRQLLCVYEKSPTIDVPTLHRLLQQWLQQLELPAQPRGQKRALSRAQSRALQRSTLHSAQRGTR